MDPQLLKKYPTMDEMHFLYVRLRSLGKSRDDAVKELLGKEAELCLPYEQQLLRRIAIGDAMAEKHELTETAGEMTECAVSEFLGFHPRMEKTMTRLAERILQAENYGPAAAYPAWEPYDPQWESGDLYAFPLSGYFPGLFLIEGKYALLFVVGKRLNAEGYTEEQVYLSLCDGEKYPQSMEELDALGYLPAFTIFREYQYLYALQLRRERELTDLHIRKVGHFAGMPAPLRERPDPERNIQYIYPCYSGKDKIVMERAICVSYQHFGTIATAEQAAEAKKEWNYGAECRAERGEAMPSVSAEKTPLEKFATRTLFSHNTHLISEIPQHCTMLSELPED